MTKEPLILSIETALEGGSVSLLKGSRLISFYNGTEKSLRLDNLIQEINYLFEESNFRLTDLDLIAISKGPGSFTGIRVGMSAAKGLGLALDCKVIGVSVLESLAFSVKENQDKREIFAVLPANRNQLFWQNFKKKGNEILSEGCVKMGDAKAFKSEILNNEKINKEFTQLVYSGKLENILENDLFNSKGIVISRIASDNVSFHLGFLSYKIYQKNIMIDEQPSPIYINN